MENNLKTKLLLISRQSWSLVRRSYQKKLRPWKMNILLDLIFPITVIYCALIYFEEYKNHPVLFKKEMISLALMVLHVVSYCRFTLYLCKDESSKMKNLMFSMGLKRISYYIGNQMILGIPAMILGIIVTLIVCTQKIVSCSSIVTFLYITIVFPLHLYAYAILLVSLIKDYILVWAVTLGLQKINVDLVESIRESVSADKETYITFTSMIIPFQSVKVFFKGSLKSVDLNPASINIDQFCTLIVSFGWATLLYILAVYIDLVVPWQVDVVPRSPLFFLKYLGIRRNKSSFETIKAKSNELELDCLSDVNTKNFNFQRTHNIKPAIQIENLNKTYSEVKVIDDLSFNIYPSEATLLLGHNGAGKTTLINMILNKVKADSGLITINEKVINTSTSRSKKNLSKQKDLLDKPISIGICPQDSILDDELNVYEHLQLFMDIKTNKEGRTQRYIEVHKSLTDMNLMKEIFKLPPELSGGTKRRLSLGLALAGGSDILILDEPSSGLDPQSRRQVWNAVKKMRQGKVILISTQHMDEAENLGDRVAIMSAGKLLACGSSLFLKKRFGCGYKLKLEGTEQGVQMAIKAAKDLFQDGIIDVVSLTTTISSKEKDNQSTLVILTLTHDDAHKQTKLLAELLAKLENNEFKSISSFNLQSSSIKDVMVNSEIVKLGDSPSSKSNFESGPSSKDQAKDAISLTSNINLKVDTTGNLIDDVIGKFKLEEKSAIAEFMDHLKIQLKKYLKISLRSYVTTLIFCFVMPIGTVDQMTWMLNQVKEPTPHLTWYGFKILYPFMITYQFVILSMNEKISHFKEIQLSSRLSPYCYWIAMLVVDMLRFMPALVAVIVLVEEDMRFVVLKATCLLMLSSAFLWYIVSTQSKNAFLSQAIMVSIHIVGKIILYIWRFLTWKYNLRDTSVKLEKIISTLMLALPSGAYTSIIISYKNYLLLNFTNFERRLPSRVQALSDNCLDITIYGFSALIIQIIAYGVILIFIEYYNFKLVRLFEYSYWINLFGKHKQKSKEKEVDIEVEKFAKEAKELILSDELRSTCSLVTANLSKWFKQKSPAVDNLSLYVKPGDCFGLIGVNGAGKSTTLSMAAGCLKPDSGKLYSNDISCYKSPTSLMKQFIGYDPQDNPIMNLTPIESLKLMAHMRNVPPENMDKIISSLLTLLEMNKHSNKLVATLSGGNRRKLALGMSLIGRPKLLVLDEPTVGVDPNTCRPIWQLLNRYRLQNNSGILVSSNSSEECEAICSKMSIISNGRLKFVGSYQHLLSKFVQGVKLKIQLDLSSFKTPDANEPSIQKKFEDQSNKTFGQLINELLESELGVENVNLVDTDNEILTFEIIGELWLIKKSQIFKVIDKLMEKYGNYRFFYTIDDLSFDDTFVLLA